MRSTLGKNTKVWLRVFGLFSCLIFCLSLPAQMCQLSFDSPFSVSLYNQVLNESMNLYGDITALYESSIAGDCLLMMTDTITGRMIRLTGSVDELIHHQQQTGACLQEDGAYLATILDRMQATYKAVDKSGNYRLLFPLFADTQRMLLRSFGL